MGSQLAIWAITAALVAAAVIVARQMPKNQRRTASQYNGRGWLLAQWPDQHLLDSYQGEPFRLLKRPTITESYSGVHRDRDFFACNFNYTDHSARGMTTTESFTDVAVTLPGPVPRIDIKRRGSVSHLADSIGLPSQTYGDAEFARQFHVSTDDETFARKIIDGGLGPYLCAQTDPPPLTIEHGEIRTWLTGTRVGAQRILTLLDHLCDADDAIPADTWSGSGESA